MAFETGVVVSVEEIRPWLHDKQTLYWAVHTTGGDQLFLEHRRSVLPLPPVGTLVHFSVWSNAAGATGYVQAFTDICATCRYPIAALSPTEWVDALNNKASEWPIRHGHEPEVA